MGLKVDVAIERYAIADNLQFVVPCESRGERDTGLARSDDSAIHHFLALVQQLHRAAD